MYMDDMIIVGWTFREHMKYFIEVLKRLEEAGRKLKCAICPMQVDFQRHIVLT